MMKLLILFLQRREGSRITNTCAFSGKDNNKGLQRQDGGFPKFRIKLAVVFTRMKL